jgi:hypothetical protein
MTESIDLRSPSLAVRGDAVKISDISCALATMASGIEASSSVAVAKFAGAYDPKRT